MRQAVTYVAAFFCRTITSVTYHAATLRVQYVGFSPEVLLALAAALEFLADLCVIVSSVWLGRRTCQAAALLCGSLACFLAFFLGNGLQHILFCLGFLDHYKVENITC